MTRVYISTQQVMDELKTRDPVAAEAHYLRLIQRRQDGAHAVVEPGRDSSVPPARYALDVDWRNGSREQEPERRRLQWESGPPTPAMWRALGTVAGLTGSVGGALVGKPPPNGGRHWRKWLAESANNSQPAPIAAYWWALAAVGLHPDPMERARVLKVRSQGYCVRHSGNQEDTGLDSRTAHLLARRIAEASGSSAWVTYTDGDVTHEWTYDGTHDGRRA